MFRTDSTTNPYTHTHTHTHTHMHTGLLSKVEIVQFARKTRLLLIRLLALVKWAGNSGNVQKCSVSVVCSDACRDSPNVSSLSW